MSDERNPSEQHLAPILFSLSIDTMSHATLVALRHRTLQLALLFICGIKELSPGAYFLRRDLYPTLVQVRQYFSHTFLPANPCLYYAVDQVS